MLARICRSSPEGETRYSPAKRIGCQTKIVSGTPNPKHVSTSYVVTPAMEAGIADHIWSIEEIVGLLE